MTRDEIISMGVNPQLARALCDYLKTHMPIGQRSADPTALVNNEGAMVGWHKAADFIQELATPRIEDPQEPGPMYSEPLRK